MRNIYTAILKILAIQLVVATVALSPLSAQPGPGGPGTNGLDGSGPVDDFGGTPQVPFDANMSIILMVAGIAYGAMQWKKKVTYSEA